ncbi:hypothetical protein PE067_10910 [Paracoccus sp. DMF-8]|uniref:hypothetical protein n=1 Tax=Paracoccus sp. DMF-8 TaxID=3019445 RepID=UPI0023E834C7|nr:hypothetical protein [Paracoccus sp. DMF-8]MDF3606608.1 hypothetical protein [Paracoccus sp. DMF-8]
MTISGSGLLKMVIEAADALYAYHMRGGTSDGVMDGTAYLQSVHVAQNRRAEGQ